MKTLAAVLIAQKRPLEIWELSLPPLCPGQVLVKIAYTGVCHSQLNEINGTKGEDPYLPHTLGHEGSGVIEAIGENVHKVKVGDHVVLSWIKGVGMDVPNSTYESPYGRVNSGAISTFMHYAVVSENRVVPIPDAMPLREAALLGCAIPTGAGVVKNEMQLQEGSSFAVFGVGGVGLSALIAAKLAKAHPIIAIDVNDEKLSMARKMGATHEVNCSKVDPIQAISNATEGSGADFVFESAGKREAMESAFCSLKAPGLCVLAGNLPKGESISIDPFDLIRGKRICGTWGGKSQIDGDVAYYTDLFLKNTLPLGDLITHEVHLEELNALFSELGKGTVGRGLVKLC